jgi:hypothetical protein
MKFIALSTAGLLGISRSILANTLLALGFAAIPLGSTALANESGLIQPAQVNSNVELTLQAKPSSTDPAAFLKVFVGHQNACCDGKSPIAGRYSLTGKTVIFDPAFDFIEGQAYTVSTHHGDADNKFAELSEFSIQSAVKVSKPEVVMIYPSGSALPENTLRFYIHFSTPMRPHLSDKFIKLVDAEGKSDNEAFMTFKQELWSEDRKQLTLLLDPGRIKRGVAQNLTLGPAFLAGNTYSIVIEAGWPSAKGSQKAPRFEKSFSVIPALRTLPDTNLWRVKSPKTLTLEPLVIEFDRPFDYQLAQNGISVLSKEGYPISGTVSVEDNEKTWRFNPDKQWTSESVKIAVDARMEDVAGNNFKDLLDHAIETGLKSTDQIVFPVKLIDASD